MTPSPWTPERPTYAQIVNDRLNVELDRGERWYKAIRSAEEIADSLASQRLCSPKPVDWDTP